MSFFSTKFPLDADSVTRIVGINTNQVVVYGYATAYYAGVREALSYGLLPTVQKAFNFCFGNKTDPTTVEGYEIQQVSDLPYISIPQEFKGGIDRLILENYKRERRGLPLIPLLFCVDGALTPQVLASKETSMNCRYTHSELRRVYKYCKEFEKSFIPELRQISRIAKETFHPVMVERQETKSFRLGIGQE